MKITPILTAILVTIALYFVIFERDSLLGFAQGTETPEETDTATTDVTDSENDLIKVVALASSAQEVESAVILRGRTEAARQVTVAAETSGQVVSDPLRKGTFVNEGDLMCELDAGTRAASLAEAQARLTEAQGRVPEAQAGLTEARARVTEAETNVTIAERGVRNGFSTEANLVAAKAALESATAGVERAQAQIAGAQAGIEAAQAGVAAAEKEIERVEIHAPFAGLLETDTAELGSLMQPGSPCATIIQLDPIKLVGFVPEAQVGKVELGATAGARLTNGSEVGGLVTFVSRSADDTTRTFRVEVEVANTDLTVGDGQTADMLINAEGRQAHLIPQSSLTLNDDGDLGVRVFGDDHIVGFNAVDIVRDTIDGVWVSGLPDQVNIITIGQEFVVDGVKIEPTFAEAKG